MKTIILKLDRISQQEKKTDRCEDTRIRDPSVYILGNPKEKLN